MTGCYHCGLPVPEDTDFQLEILHEPRSMCCHGCLSVAQAIVENGLDDYYRYRTEMPKTADDLVPDELRKLDLYDHPEVQKSFVREEGQHLKQASLILEGITCAACIWLNERHLKQLAGVKEANVNYASHRARVTWDDEVIKLSTILAEIRKLGYQAHPFNAQQQESLRKQSKKIEFRRMAVAGLSTGQVMMLAVALYAGATQGMEIATGALLRWFSLLMTVPAMLYSAVPFYQSAYIALRRRQLNMDVPIVIGLLAGFAGSLWATLRNDGVVYYDTLTMLIFLLLSTRFLERNAREKSVEAAENLLRLTPAMATRVNQGQAELVPVMDLMPGDLILAKPGETIAADGLVEEGASSVDESLLTGESRALPKQAGDKVVAGSINYESPLTIKVTDVGENTVLAGIARLLDRAQAEKPRMAQTADMIAEWFTYALLAIVFVAGLGWWYFNPSKIFDVVLSVLVVSCPCALSLAAPAAFAAAGSHLIKRGVLLTRGHALETLARVTHVVFDKTGTLTAGKPELVATHTYGDMDEGQCLRLAASLEQASEHPLAQSFLKVVDKHHLAVVEGAENLPGQGVAGTVQGIRYSLGNATLAPQLAMPSVESVPGATIVWLCSPEQVLAAFVLADSPRPQAAELIQALKQQGVRVSMLSGDSPAAAAWHASALGIDQVIGGLSPDGKLNELMRMQASGEVIAMVGDGVNDAPVLAGAPVSIAMGSGTQMARASGDIILLSENLMEIAHARFMSRFAMNVIRQNFIWSLAYNLIAVPVAVAGHLSPWLAALGMSVSSLIVVLNALRLR